MIQPFREHTIIATPTERKRAGTAILLRKNVWESEPKQLTMESEYTQERNRHNDGQRFTIATVTRKNSNNVSIIAAVYGPTASNKLGFMKKFISKIWDNRSRVSAATIIIAGDLSLHLDRVHHMTLAQRELEPAMEDLNHVDSYRIVNPYTKGYTCWDKKGNNPTRIDYVLLSQSIMTTEMTATTICGSSLQSDHDAVWIRMNGTHKQKRKIKGPKPFNDKGFIYKIEESIKMRLKATQTGEKKPEDTLKTVQENPRDNLKSIEEDYNMI